MSAEENTKIVKDAYAAFGRGDIPALLSMLSEDIEWKTPGKGLPLAGTYLGPNAVATFFEKLGIDSEILVFEPREFIAEGDRVMVVGWERAKVKATNRTVDLEWVMAFTVRNGKITNFQEYTDTQAIAWAYEAAAGASA